MSSPEDEYKVLLRVVAEPLNLASETPTVFHGRELPDRVVCSQWLRKEAARQGYAWRQRRRAQQLCSLRAACVPPGGVLGGEALRLAPPGVGVLVETLRELREEDEYEWQGVWRGCWGSGGCEVCAGGPRDDRS